MRQYLFAGILGLLLAGCGENPIVTGTLELQVSAPTGVSPKVGVQGTSFSQNIEQTGSTTLKDLQPGNYTISTPQVTSNAGLLYKANLTLNGSVLAANVGSSQTATVVAAKTTVVGVNYVEAPPQLQVTISVTPEVSGFKPKVTLSKGSSNTDVDASQTLDTLAAGTYSVTASDAPTNYIRVPSANSVTLEAGKLAQLTVSYIRNVGSIQVQISAEAGCTPSIAINLGSTTVQTITASSTLNNLTPGTYTVVPAASSGCAVTAEPSSLTVQAGATAGPSVVSYTRQAGKITANLTGLPTGTQASLTLTPQSGSPISKTGTGSVVFDGLPPGQYTLSTKPVVVAGSFVDSYFTAATPSPATFTLTGASPTATALVAYTQRAGTGKIWVAGNGQFSNGGRGNNPTNPPEQNGAYSISDAALGSSGTFSTFITPAATNGAFRINFDRDGNMYVLYQYNSASGSPAHVLRISEANLRMGKTAESDPGNTLIDGGIWAWPTTGTLADNPGGAAELTTNEPADLSFDKNGNLWVINDNLGLFACITASTLKAAPAGIYEAGSRVWGPGTGLYHYVLNTVGQNADNRPFMIPHALVFDNTGNLWFTAGGFQDKRSGETSPVKRSTLNRISSSKISYAANGDCNGGDIGITPANLGQYVDVRLDASLSDSDLGAIVKPVTLTLEPGGNAIWIGDFGGNSGGTGDLYRDANAAIESAIRIPLSGSNLTTSANVQTATVSHRVTISAGTGTDKGLQQVFGLAFDKNGYMWAASNNNVEILTTDIGLAANGLTDRKGKLYQLDVRNISSQPTYTGTNSLNLRPQNPKVFSVGDVGVGLIGVSINLPNPTSLPNINPPR